MKLYTEEQVIEVIQLSRTFAAHMKTEDIVILVTDKLTPIELPSDDEMKQKANEYTIDDDTYYSFINGAIWMKEKYLTKTNNL